MVANRSFVLLHTTPLVRRRNPRTAAHDAADSRALRTIPVPDQHSYLLTGPHRQPRLAPRRPAKRSIGEATATGGKRTPAIVFEPIAMCHQHFLLMLLAGGARAHLNGQPASPVNLLRVGDEVHVEAQRFFVSAQRTASSSSPAPDQVGATCPFCRLQIAADTRVFTCACGTVLHREDGRWPEASRLACAEMSSTCPNCKQAIDFEEGLEWEPSL